MARRPWFVLCLCGLMVLAGCTGFRPVPTTTSPDVAKSFVQPGDHVRITVRGGERFETTVVQIQADGFVVSGTRLVPYNEIVRLERHGFSAGRTITLGLVVGGLFAAFLSALSHMPVGM